MPFNRLLILLMSGIFFAKLDTLAIMGPKDAICFIKSFCCETNSCVSFVKLLRPFFPKIFDILP